jgi:hypothetical protein
VLAEALVVEIEVERHQAIGRQYQSAAYVGDFLIAALRETDPLIRGVDQEAELAVALARRVSAAQRELRRADLAEPGRMAFEGTEELVQARAQLRIEARPLGFEALVAIAAVIEQQSGAGRVREHPRVLRAHAPVAQVQVEARQAAEEQRALVEERVGDLRARDAEVGGGALQPELEERRVARTEQVERRIADTDLNGEALDIRNNSY